jgi:hypothetical protein
MTKRRIGYVPLTNAALLMWRKPSISPPGGASSLNLWLIPPGPISATSSWPAISMRRTCWHRPPSRCRSGSDNSRPWHQWRSGSTATRSRCRKRCSNCCCKRRKARSPIPGSPPRRSPGSWQDAARREAPLTFGHVFPFSSHHYQLRLWLRAGHSTRRRAAAVHGLDPAQGPGVLRRRAMAHADDVRALAGAVDDASRWGGGTEQPELLKDAAHEHGLARRESLDDRRVLDNPASISGPALAETGLRLDEDAVKPDPARRLALRPDGGGRPTVYSDGFAEAAATVCAPAPGPPISGPATAPVAFAGPAFSPNDIASHLMALDAERLS